MRRPQGPSPTTATLSLAIVSALYGSTAPSPLYTLYQARLGLSTTTMASLYAAYIAGVLLTLWGVSRLRKGTGTPLVSLQVGLLCVITSCVVMSLAQSLEALYLGRVLAGIGTGAITGTASAGLAALDIERGTTRASLIATGSFTAGAALGPLVSTALLMAQTAPLVAPFMANALLAAGALAGLRTMRKPSGTPHAAPVERPAPFHVAETLPSAFISYWTVAVAWTTGAFFVALAPKFMAGLTPGAAEWAGFVVTVFQAVAGVGQVFADRLDRRFSVLSGCALLATGWGLCVAATACASPPLFWAGALSCALGYAALFVGASGLLFDSMQQRQDPRGAASRFWMSGYVGAATSAVAVGWLMDHVGAPFVIDIVAIVSFIGVCVSIVALLKRRPVRSGRDPGLTPTVKNAPAAHAPIGIWRVRTRH